MRATDHRFREDNERRIDRMNTWIELAETTTHEHVRFVFLWIAYEAAHQNHQNESSERTQGEERRRFHDRLARCDRGRLQSILRARSADIVRILELRQAHPSFWKRWREDEGVASAAEWERKFRKRIGSAIDGLNAALCRDDQLRVKREMMSGTLNNLFTNLSIVRHQIVHGGSAGPKSRGRTQVILGARLLKALVPCFRDSIQWNIDKDWGKPPYPRVGSVADEECPPPWL